MMRFRKKPGSLRQFFAELFLAALALNWVWEMLQMPAFDHMMGHSWRSTALTCTFASLGDAAITLGIYAAVAVITKRWQWAVEGKWQPYLMAALLGMAVAVVIEKVAIAMGFWTYSRHMPVVPVLGVGLVPLLQLTLLIPVAIRLLAWWISPKRRDKDNG
jgi:hypothetical protein